MKYIIPFLALICIVVTAACNGSEKADARTAFYPDSAVTKQAVALVTENSPEKAAADLVGWLAEAPSADREFSRSLAREVFRLYTNSGDSTALSRFSRALENCKDSLDIEGQVKVFVAVSKPVTLGSMLRNDPQGEKLAELITIQYEGDSIALKEFTDAYRSE